MDSDTRIKIAVNRTPTGKIPSGDSRWGTFNDSFVNQQLDPIEIANSIYTGHAYAGWHNGRRCTDNFLLAQHIGVDMDTDDSRSTFDAIRQHEFFKTYGGLLHTTPSHSVTSPRSRILFFLDEPIQDPNAFQAAAKFVVSLFPGADSAVTDASRFFYGAFDCDIEIPFNILPLSHLRHYYTQARKNAKIQKEALGYQPRQQPERTQPRSEYKDDNLHDILLQRAISQSPGGRHNAGLWLACQLRDNAYSKVDAEVIVASYAATVGNTGTHAYTEQEALKTLQGVYARTAREPWTTAH